MGNIEKLKKRLLADPKDFTYAEARHLLRQLGFEESAKGKTSGSRVKFYRPSDQKMLLLHKPHPGDIMCIAATRQLAAFIKDLEG